MPVYPDPAGGEMEVANREEAEARGWTPEMGTFGVRSEEPSSGGGTTSGGGDAMSQINPDALGQNQYGDDLFQTPNGIKTGTQIMQELQAANWDGVGNPVEVYNRTAAAAGGTQPSSTTAVGKTGTQQVNQQGAQQLGSAIERLLQALVDGNKMAFDQAVKEFDLTFGLDKDKFAEDIRRFNLNFPLAEAGLTGTYQGQPTLAAQSQWAQLFGAAGPPTPGQQTLAAQQQYFAQQAAMMAAAQAAQANPFRQAQIYGQANRILQGQGVAGFQAPGVVQGVGTVGGNQQGGLGYLQQIIDDIRNPTPNQTSADAFLAQTPTPNKLDSVSFARAAPTAQNLILQAMQEKYGIDPQDALAQIQNTLPQFTAPNTTTTMIRRTT